MSVCLSVLIFVWALNHVKIDQLSQKLDMFFMEITLVWTSIILNIYVRCFLQGRIKMLNICLLAKASAKIGQGPGNFGMFLNYIGSFYIWKIVIVSYIEFFYRVLQKFQYINIVCSFLMTQTDEILICFKTIYIWFTYQN